jgi:hypothetical protein
MASTDENSTSAEPPSYEVSVGLAGATTSPNAELPHFVLHGTLIFPSPPPSRAVYELNSPPCDAKSGTYELRKIAYRVSARGEGGVRSRVDPIYAIRPFRVPLWLSSGRKHVLINGLEKGRTKEAHMAPAWDAPVGWGVKELRLRSEQRFVDRFRRKGAVVWVNRAGVLIAEETRSTRNWEGKVERLPGLKVHIQLEEGLLDILVACWVARLWKEAESELSVHHS